MEDRARDLALQAIRARVGPPPERPDPEALGPAEGELEAELAGAEAERTRLEGVLARARERIGEAVRVGDEERARELQAERRDTEDELERATLWLESLEARRPQAQARDAAPHLTALTKRASEVAELGADARRRLAGVVAELRQTVRLAYGAAVEMDRLDGEAGQLEEAHSAHLGRADLAPAPAPSNTTHRAALETFEELKALRFHATTRLKLPMEGED